MAPSGRPPPIPWRKSLKSAPSSSNGVMPVSTSHAIITSEYTSLALDSDPISSPCTLGSMYWLGWCHGQTPPAPRKLRGRGGHPFTAFKASGPVPADPLISRPRAFVLCGPHLRCTLTYQYAAMQVGALRCRHAATVVSYVTVVHWRARRYENVRAYRYCNVTEGCWNDAGQHLCQSGGPFLTALQRATRARK
jgi:hypothetical protein